MQGYIEFKDFSRTCPTTKNSLFSRTARLSKNKTDFKFQLIKFLTIKILLINLYISVLPLFGAAYVAPNKGKTIYFQDESPLAELCPKQLSLRKNLSTLKADLTIKALHFQVLF